MKKFLMTTAVVALTSVGALAQTTGTAGQAGQAQQPQMGQQQMAGQQMQQQRLVPAFLVSDFMGKEVFTLDIDDAVMLRNQGAMQQPGVQRDRGVWDQARLRWETGDTFLAERDRWQNVGNIQDIVMTGDGEIRGILIDVGGFLGIGTRRVMVDKDELFFVLDQQPGATGGWFDDTADAFFIVAAMTREELEALPEWDDANLRRGFEARPHFDRQHEPGAAMGHDGQVAQQEGRALGTQQQQAAVQPQQQAQPMQQQAQPPQGYAPMEPGQMTAETLRGAPVFGAENQEIGQVQDLVLAADGTTVEAIVLDIGGFLGVGQHRVALQIQEVEILHDQQQQVRIQVPMTRQQLEQLPEYQL